MRFFRWCKHEKGPRKLTKSEVYELEYLRAEYILQGIELQNDKPSTLISWVPLVTPERHRRAAWCILLNAGYEAEEIAERLEHWDT